MLNLRVVQSRFGDSLILENGAGNRRKYILVDGGPTGVYGPYLKPELKRIAESGGKLELMVLSHVDNDHILGLLEMMDDLKKLKAAGQPPVIEVAGMWHNGFSKILPREVKRHADDLEAEMAVTPLPDPDHPLRVEAGPFGVSEGHDLQMADVDLGIPRNAGFPDQLISLENAPKAFRVGGIKIWILGPSAKNLERLRGLWVKWLMRESLPFGPGEEPVQPDDSTANLSSIMFLAEAGRRRILLTGDGLGDDLVEGLEKAGLLPPDGTMHVDILKLPHHGSARNAVGKLFDRVLADTYVLCADGRYGNPDWQTLVWLVDSACHQNRQIKIFATNLAPSLERLLKERPPESNFYTLTIMPKGTTSAVL